MKRSNDEEKVKQPCADDSVKKQKVTNEINENDGSNAALIHPQLDLMPKISATPPEVPLTTEEKAQIKQKYRHAWQTPPPKVYKPKDYALWPQIAVNVLRQQINIQNHVYASDHMRHWFAEHAGLRAPPPKAPRSSYSVYYNRQKSLWGEKHGKWSQAKESKRVGAMWRALSERDKKECDDVFDKKVAQFDANDDFWQAEAEKWGKTKQMKLKENKEETDPERRVRLKLSGLSADDFYYYKWW